jgi:hypothetical protein
VGIDKVHYRPSPTPPLDTFLSFSADRQRLLCEQGRQRLGLAPASIEKDFWVCWTLRKLFSLQWDILDQRQIWIQKKGVFG